MPILTAPRTRLGPWGVSRFPDGPFTGKSETVVVAGTPRIRAGIFAYERQRAGVHAYARKRPGVLA